MKNYFFLLVAVIVGLSSSSQGRPTIGNASSERITFDELGISILVPDNTELIGPNAKESANYIWPWLSTANGMIEIAKASPAVGTNLSDKITSYLSHTKSPLVTADITPKQIGDIEVFRASCEGTRGFKVVRYYFLTPDDQLAFFHLHSWDDLDALESVILSMQKTEQGAAANP